MTQYHLLPTLKCNSLKGSWSSRKVSLCLIVNRKRKCRKFLELHWLPQIQHFFIFQVLDLGGNNLQILPREVFSRHGLLNLQKLKLSNCKIGQIDPTAFRGNVAAQHYFVAELINI